MGRRVGGIARGGGVVLSEEQRLRVMCLPLGEWSAARCSRRVLRAPESLEVVGWAHRNIRLDAKNNARPGPLDLNITPYLVEIIEAFVQDDGVGQVTFCASTQVGKTTLMIVVALMLVKVAPGPLLWVLPKEDVAKSFAKERLVPVVRHSPSLLEELNGATYDIRALSVDFRQMLINFGWATSPAELASRAVRYLLGDEVNKWPKFSGTEASPIELARERTRTYEELAKVLLASTPTDESGYISTEYAQSDQRRLHVPCPHCGGYEPLRFEQVRWPEEHRFNPDAIEALRSAWYQCPRCEGRIEDHHKPAMLRAGVWCPAGCVVDSAGTIVGVLGQGRHRGYHINCLYSPFLTWSKIAAKSIRAASTNLVQDWMNFVNSWLAEAFQVLDTVMVPGRFEALRAGYQRSQVPVGAVILTAGLDVQIDRTYYAIWAWGNDEGAALVDYGVVTKEEGAIWLAGAGLGAVAERKRLPLDIAAAMWFCFRSEFGVQGRDGAGLRVAFGLCDSRYRRDEVRRAARYFGPRVVLPSMGARNPMHEQWQVRTLDQDQRGRRVASGLKYVLIDTGSFKDELAQRYAAEDGPGLRFPQDVCGDFQRQWLSEHKVRVEKKRFGEPVTMWVKRPGHDANHWWDCSVYARCAADMKGVGRRVISPQYGEAGSAVAATVLVDAGGGDGVGEAGTVSLGSWFGGGASRRGRG